MKSNMRAQWGAILAVLILALSLLTALPAAGDQRLPLLNRGRGEPSPVRLENAKDAPSNAIRLQGRFTWNGRRGLTLGGRSILLSGRTTTFPSLGLENSLPDPARLNGQTATVFGARAAGGIEAVLIILEGSGPSESGDLLQGLPADQWIPSEANPAVGQLLPTAPR